MSGTARERVTARLAAQAGRFPDLRFESDAPLLGTDGLEGDGPRADWTAGLSARDAALAHAIEDAVVRRWLTLSYLLEHFLRRPMHAVEAGVRAALLAGAAQVLLFERVPAYAAIDEAVEIAKRTVRPGAGGMVNAVLRRIAELRADAPGPSDRDTGPSDAAAAADTPRACPGDAPRRGREAWSDRRDELPLADGSAVRLTRAILPADERLRLAVATSHPIGLIERWIETLGGPAARSLALHSLVQPPTVLNVSFAPELMVAPLLVAPLLVAPLSRAVLPDLPKSTALESGATSRQALSAAAAPAGDAFALTPHAEPGHAVFSGSRSALVRLLNDHPTAWVQDPASSRAVAAAAGCRPALVVDLCAGRGTKTRQLAMTFPDAEIVATDADVPRIAGLARTFAGSPRIRAMPMDAAIAYARGRAGLVLADVPCSNTGVLARRPEAKYRADRAQLDRLTAIQREILGVAAGLLDRSAPRGAAAIRPVVVYSTCSVEPEENDALARAAAGALGLGVGGGVGAGVRESVLTLPAGLPGGPPERYHDGSFVAVID